MPTSAKVHLIRNTFRDASKKYWGNIATDVKPIHRAPSREAAWAAFEEFEEKCGTPYPAIGQLWRNALEQFVPFLAYDAEIRTVLCSTNAIESLNARYRRAVTVRGHFPTERAAMKCLYLVTRSLDPKGTGRHDEPCAGSQRSTPSRSPSATGCPRQRATDENWCSHR